MYSIILIFVGLMLLVTPIFLHIGPDDKKDNEDMIRKKTKKLMTAFFVFIVILLILSTIAISMLITQRNNIVENCQPIAIPNSDRILYYDENSNEYFFTKSSNWDLTKLFDRDVIDYEVGESIKNSSEEILKAMKNIEEKIQQ